MSIAKPATKPVRPEFSSGPCAKRPGWSTEALKSACLGRSHRSKPGKAKLAAAIALTREVLEVPATHHIAIVPGSDTGAVEMAMWSLLGARGVDMLVWESFGEDWVTDAVKELKLADTRTIKAGYGQIPDLSKVRADADVVFTWNGTTSGARVANADWIAADRTGLTICDATSAAFAQKLEWDKLDVVTFSWQKVLGGEGAHGMLILGPRAVERLESYTPVWPMPKLFRMVKKGKLDLELFQGATINTPSLLATEDYLDALNWAKGLGGLSALQARADANLAVMAAWVERTPWIAFLCDEPAHRSNTSVTFRFTDPRIAGMSEDAQQEFVKRFTGLLEKEGVAFDIAGYRSAPPGLRIWCGATVEQADLLALTPWLDWAFATLAAELA
jgi:phosphoserine aminotransferase